MKCFNCASDENENCSTLRNISTIDSIECVGNCAIWIVEHQTFRGCKPTTSTDEPKMSICNFENCNNFIFPEDRQKCVKCEESDDFCMKPKESDSYPCKNYSIDDKCYTLIYGDNLAIRGCVSDDDDTSATCEMYGETCLKCTEPACEAFTESSTSIQCVTCNDGLACGYNPRVDVPMEVCEDLCFSYKNETNFIRGCLSNFPELKPQCQEITEFCQTCDTSSCNDVKLVAEKCVECENCKNIPHLMTPTICGKATFDQAGCYLSDKRG